MSVGPYNTPLENVIVLNLLICVELYGSNEFIYIFKNCRTQK